MAFTPEDIATNKRFFEHKLSAVKQQNDVVKWAKEGKGDFVLLDSRDRESFAKGHVQGALCVPYQEISDLASQLPRDRELVTFCWNHL